MYFQLPNGILPVIIQRFLGETSTNINISFFYYIKDVNTRTMLFFSIAVRFRDLGKNSHQQIQKAAFNCESFEIKN